jgi:polyhydroxybutyrate depolymerase
MATLNAVLTVAATASCLPTAPALGADELMSGGVRRTYSVHAPASSSSNPLPVLIVFHGAGGRGISARSLGFDTWADSLRFVVVYPDAAPNTRGTWALGCAQCTWADIAGIDDYAFVGDLVDDVGRKHSIDRTRVFAAGFSLGGSLAYDLACHVPGLLAGTAVVASLPSVEELELCRSPRPAVRVITSIGGSDGNVPWFGGPGGGGAIYQNAETTARDWADNNGCAPAVGRRDLEDRDRDGFLVRVLEYGNCADGSFVRFYRVEGLGHGWPRFADLDITREIALAFFGGAPRVRSQ